MAILANPCFQMDGLGWNVSGLFCFTVCLACLLPCVVVGQNESRRSGSSCCCACAWSTLMCMLCTYFTGAVGWAWYLGNERGKTRAALNILGNQCSDCCVHCWCAPCALTQEALELQFRKPIYVAHAAPMVMKMQ